MVKKSSVGTEAVQTVYLVDLTSRTKLNERLIFLERMLKEPILCENCKRDIRQIVAYITAVLTNTSKERLDDSEYLMTKEIIDDLIRLGGL